MKILFDDQVFTWQKFGGISRYFTQIISNFPAEINAEISIKYSDNEYLHNANIINGLENIYQPIDHFLFGIKLPGKRKLFKLLSEFNSQKYLECSFLNKKLSIEHLKNQDFDIFHPTYYDDYFLQYLGNKPFVLTIHDMIHEIYPEITNNPKISEQKASLAKCASHIIAVSERTKKDIIDILGVSPNKISVVYHANSLTNKASASTIQFILFSPS